MKKEEIEELKELSQRYFNDPEEGGDYLSMGEVNRLACLQRTRITLLEHSLRYYTNLHSGEYLPECVLETIKWGDVT